MIILVSLRDLTTPDGHDLTSGTEAEIAARLREIYNFLPKEARSPSRMVSSGSRFPTRSLPTRSRQSACNERATERANKGEYQKAVGIWTRVIELDPTNVEARRNLGMAYMELKEPEKAREHLIEAATLDPKDAWSYVVLGNILARDEKNWDAAERFYRKAVASAPR